MSFFRRHPLLFAPARFVRVGRATQIIENNHLRAENCPKAFSGQYPLDFRDARWARMLAQLLQPLAMAAGAGPSFSTAQQDTGLVVVLHLPPFLNSSIHLWMPHLNLMVKRCERNGVGLATPGRRSSPQAVRSTSSFAERDHTCTGNRTGNIKEDHGTVSRPKAFTPRSCCKGEECSDAAGG